MSEPTHSPTPPTDDQPASSPNRPKFALTFKNNTTLQLILGFLGFILINGIGLVISTYWPGVKRRGMYDNGFYPDSFVVFNYIWIILNIGLLVGLGRYLKTRGIAFGMLSALAFIFLVVIFCGIFTTATCFSLK